MDKTKPSKNSAMRVDQIRKKKEKKKKQLYRNEG